MSTRLAIVDGHIGCVVEPLPGGIPEPGGTGLTLVRAAADGTDERFECGPGHDPGRHVLPEDVRVGDVLVFRRGARTARAVVSGLEHATPEPAASTPERDAAAAQLQLAKSYAQACAARETAARADVEKAKALSDAAQLAVEDAAKALGSLVVPAPEREPMVLEVEVGATALPQPVAPRCSYCRDMPAPAERVVCSRCLALYHRLCWESDGMKKTCDCGCTVVLESPSPVATVKVTDLHSGVTE
jgi:hypothetical protein